ncbi:MAG: DUF4080 domain-containing protein, partial [Proteobacteria bacterium]|nr:DUF4080 domain-containing protein [Pseudomonadota bacterium]
ANLGELFDVSTIVEFTSKERPLQMAERLLANKPKIVGVGVYIWNIDQATQLVQILKRACPTLIVVIGGPEVSYEWEDQLIFREADYLIRGEGDLAFAKLCREILRGRRATEADSKHRFPVPKSRPTEPGGPGVNSEFAGAAPADKVIDTPELVLDEVQLPYDLYDDEDLAHRVILVEASRGCAFRCQFCLSAIDPRVRPFPAEPFFTALKGLYYRGVRRFKFVDRSFNFDQHRAERLLDFFLDECDEDCFVHIEVVPDRLHPGLRHRIERFPPGLLQLELGVQTWTPDVARRIGRRQDYGKLIDNLEFLTNNTGAHLHADLVIGLPGESLDHIQQGFDALFALNPHEIQVGILKRLRGAPIDRHSVAFAMVYSPIAPYEILQNNSLAFDQIKELRRFARVWDHVVNRGHFIDAAPLIWAGKPSVFEAFASFVSYLYAEDTQAPMGFASLARQLHRYLHQAGHPLAAVDAALGADYRRVTKRQKIPAIFRSSTQRPSKGPPKRQLLHRS